MKLMLWRYYRRDSDADVMIILTGTFASLVFWPHDRKFMYIGLYLPLKIEF
jgi:hypothetical protein